ncbi:MAG: glycosyltransferase, partial [Pseudomonadota bacterium]|nr:glycosyltransferase [Pseudomonadota bacterium]
EKIGVEFRGIFYHVFDFFACLGDLNIVFNTREYQPFVNQLVGDFRFVGASIPDGRDAGSMKFDFFNKKKLVYVSLGTLHNQDLGFYRAVMDALADEDLNVMMSIGRNNSVADLGPIPDNFTVENFVPQLEVLKRADAFITHGGMNSLNEALYFGVPVIVVPQQVEQAFNTRRLGRFGVSQSLGRKALTPEGIRRQVMQVLNDAAFKNSAIAYGRSLRQAGGYKAAASAIIDFARQRQPQQASAAQARRRA